MQAGVQYKMRLPEDVHRWLRAEAQKTLRSVSSEIVFALRERMAATGEGLGNHAPAAALDEAALAGGPINQR